MDDFGARQLAALHAQVQENWYQFFKAELLTCFTAIDFGNTEFDLGSREVAVNEIYAAEKGIDTILRFLPQMESAERRDEIGAALPRLREGVKA